MQQCLVDSIGSLFECASVDELHPGPCRFIFESSRAGIFDAYGQLSVLAYKTNQSVLISPGLVGVVCACGTVWHVTDGIALGILDDYVVQVVLHIQVTVFAVHCILCGHHVLNRAYDIHVLVVHVDHAREVGACWLGGGSVRSLHLNLVDAGLQAGNGLAHVERAVPSL